MKTKTYVITGSASGIGKALIERIAEDNVVFAGYRNPKHEQMLRDISPNIYPFYVDYTKPETIKAALNYIHTICSKIDTLVNIAGCVVAGPIERIEMDEIRRQFDVNVFGHLEFSKGLLDLLDGGKIINISSMASFGVFPFISPYCTSKKCLDMFFNSFLIETKKDIKVISIKPGVIATPLWGKSVSENSKYFDNCEGFEKEMRFLISNAQKNETKGLSVQKVVDVILKADRAKKPKLSYAVGKDAYFASLFALLPQGVVNTLVKFGLKKRLGNQNKMNL